MASISWQPRVDLLLPISAAFGNVLHIEAKIAHQHFDVGDAYGIAQSAHKQRDNPGTSELDFTRSPSEAVTNSSYNRLLRRKARNHFLENTPDRKSVSGWLSSPARYFASDACGNSCARGDAGWNSHVDLEHAGRKPGYAARVQHLGHTVVDLSRDLQQRPAKSIRRHLPATPDSIV